MSNLRTALLDLAQKEPAMRAHLLPLLREAGLWQDIFTPGQASTLNPADAISLRPATAKILARGPSTAHDQVQIVLREMIALIGGEAHPEVSSHVAEVIERVTRILVQLSRRMRQGDFPD